MVKAPNKRHEPTVLLLLLLFVCLIFNSRIKSNVDAPSEELKFKAQKCFFSVNIDRTTKKYADGKNIFPTFSRPVGVFSRFPLKLRTLFMSNPGSRFRGKPDGLP